jgi:hypothetical protein
MFFSYWNFILIIMLNGTVHPEALGQSEQGTWFHEMKWIKATQQTP